MVLLGELRRGSAMAQEFRLFLLKEAGRLAGGYQNGIIEIITSCVGNSLEPAGAGAGPEFRQKFNVPVFSGLMD